MSKQVAGIVEKDGKRIELDEHDVHRIKFLLNARLGDHFAELDDLEIVRRAS